MPSACSCTSVCRTRTPRQLWLARFKRRTMHETTQTLHARGVTPTSRLVTLVLGLFSSDQDSHFWIEGCNANNYMKTCCKRAAMLTKKKIHTGAAIIRYRTVSWSQWNCLCFDTKISTLVVTPLLHVFSSFLQLLWFPAASMLFSALNTRHLSEPDGNSWSELLSALLRCAAAAAASAHSIQSQQSLNITSFRQSLIHHRQWMVIVETCVVKS